MLGTLPDDDEGLREASAMLIDLDRAAKPATALDDFDPFAKAKRSPASDVGGRHHSTTSLSPAGGRDRQPAFFSAADIIDAAARSRTASDHATDNTDHQQQHALAPPALPPPLGQHAPSSSRSRAADSAATIGHSASRSLNGYIRHDSLNRNDGSNSEDDDDDGVFAQFRSKSANKDKKPLLSERSGTSGGKASGAKGQSSRRVRFAKTQNRLSMSSDEDDSAVAIDRTAARFQDDATRIKAGIWTGSADCPLDGSAWALDDCEDAGVLAFSSGSNAAVWRAPVQAARLLTFDCGVDLNADGVPDCYYTTALPTTVGFLSGATGALLSQTSDDDDALTRQPSAFSRPVPVADGADGLMVKDRVPEFVFARSSRERGRVDFILLESRGATNAQLYDAQRIFTVNGSTVAGGPAVWRAGNGQDMMVVALRGVAGLRAWPLGAFLRRQYKKTRVLFPAYTFDAANVGSFGDLDGDGRPELVACVDAGRSVRAFSADNKTLWSHQIAAYKCVPDSIVPAQVALKKAPSVVVGFRADDGTVYELLLLDGKSGVRLRLIGKCNSAFDASPLVLGAAPYGGQDKVIFWHVANRSVQLVAAGYPWRNLTVLYESALSHVGDSVTDREAVLRVQMTNQRFTGALTVAGGAASLFFATNSYETMIVAHRLKLTCACDAERQPADTKCGRFRDRQPWPSFRGAASDGYLLE